jgi:SAM-dependent methyltransferase
MANPVREFNELHIELFSRPYPIPKAARVLAEWMGTGHRAIDVGCGSGFYTDFCRRQGNTVVGVEITSQVETAHTRALAVCQGSVEQTFPFPNATFSLALCIEVVEHLLQPELMIAEVHRVLKPGGVLILTTPNYAYWVLRILYLFGRPPVGLSGRHFNSWIRRVFAEALPPWQDPHIRFFTPNIARQFLAEYGFEKISIRSTFVAFPSGLAPFLPALLGLPLRAIGKLVGNLNFLGDAYPSLLAAGLLIRAVKQ